MFPYRDVGVDMRLIDFFEPIIDFFRMWWILLLLVSLSMLLMYLLVQYYPMPTGDFNSTGVT